MSNEILELVVAYDIEVLLTNTLKDTSGDVEEWRAKGARAADCFWSNIPGAWMDGFCKRLNTLNGKMYPEAAYPQFTVRLDEKPMIENQSISKKVRSMMLD